MSNNPTTQHKTVLISEVLEYLNPEPNKIYVDATFGGGGHTRAILNQEPKCKVIGLDWDNESLERHAPALEAEFGNRLTVLWGNFAHVYRLLKKNNISRIDGVLADFGTSQYQIFHKQGFSFMVNSPLDMRMSPAHQRETAADIINHYSDKDLAQLFYTFGEEPHGRKIAEAIVVARKIKPIETTLQLAHLIESVVPRSKQPRSIHPATKVFQALRIKVNQELENIEGFLKTSLSMLNPGGRLVCISFHSLEDRIVKHFFKDHVGKLEILTTKPVGPTDDEIAQNPSSRSAKLRAARKY